MITQLTIKKAAIWALTAALFALHLLTRSVAHAAESPLEQWKQVTTSTCRISFPSIPQLVQQRLPLAGTNQTLTYDIYIAPFNEKNLCLFLIATYPMALPAGQEEAGLKGLIRGIVGHSPSNKLLYANMIDHKGYPAVDFQVESPTSIFRGQALIVGNKLYLIAVEGHLDGFNESAFSAFLKSFLLLKSVSQ